MKENKLLSRFLVSAVLCLSTLAAVSCEKEEEQQSSSAEESQTEFVYSDFDDWAPDFSTIRVLRNSGSIYVNEDPAYTIDGTGKSCLIRPLGSFTSGGSARFLFPTYSQMYGFDYRDFREIRSISFDFYNAEDHDLEVALGLVPKITNIDIFSTTKEVWQTLPSKQWTKVSYEVDQTALSFLYDISVMDGFYMAFPNAGSRLEEDAPRIYLDGIQISKYLVAPPIGEGLQLGEMEYLDFEDPLQEMAISSGGPSYCLPDANIVKAADRGIEAPSGEHVFEWVCHQGQKGDGSNWSYLVFSSIVTSTSIFGNLPMDEAMDLILSVDVYNDTETTRYIEFDYLYYEMAIFHSLEVEPKTWKTFHFSIGDALAKWGDAFQKVGQLRFVYPEYTEPEDMRLFIDNLRFDFASDILPGTIVE